MCLITCAPCEVVMQNKNCIWVDLGASGQALGWMGARQLTTSSALQTLCCCSSCAFGLAPQDSPYASLLILIAFVS